MKLIDALKNVVRSSDNQAHLDYDFFRGECSISYDYDFLYDKIEEGLKAFWVYKWLSTDTWVGMSALYLNDELVGYTKKSARKSSFDIHFVDEESYNKVRDFLISCSEKDKPKCISYELEKEIGDFYSVYYVEQLLTDTGVYGGKPCVVVKKHKNDYRTGQLTIQFEDGTTQKIPIDEFLIPYSTN